MKVSVNVDTGMISLWLFIMMLSTCGIAKDIDRIADHTVGSDDKKEKTND